MSTELTHNAAVYAHSLPLALPPPLPSSRRVSLADISSRTSLTQCSIMYEQQEEPAAIEPILQVLSVKRVNQTGQGTDRYRSVATALPSPCPAPTGLCGQRARRETGLNC